MFCGKCGKELPDNAQFCGNCGTKTRGISPTPDLPPTVNNQTEEKKVTDADVGGKIFIGLLIVAGLVFAFLLVSFIDKAVDKGGKFIEGAISNAQSNQQGTTSSSTNNSQQSQRSTTTQQPNSNNSQQTTPSNTETLTYYINGNAKTANVVFLGNMEKRFSLDAGGNVVLYDRLQRPGENWTDWASEGIIKRQDGSFDDVADIAFWLNEISFSNAIEETTDGMRLILIWQKIDDFLFGTTKNFVAVDFNNDCVYTMQKVYERK